MSPCHWLKGEGHGIGWRLTRVTGQRLFLIVVTPSRGTVFHERAIDGVPDTPRDMTLLRGGLMALSTTGGSTHERVVMKGPRRNALAVYENTTLDQAQKEEETQ